MDREEEELELLEKQLSERRKKLEEAKKEKEGHEAMFTPFLEMLTAGNVPLKEFYQFAKRWNTQKKEEEDLLNSSIAIAAADSSEENDDGHQMCNSPTCKRCVAKNKSFNSKK